MLAFFVLYEKRKKYFLLQFYNFVIINAYNTWAWYIKNHKIMQNMSSFTPKRVSSYVLKRNGNLYVHIWINEFIYTATVNKTSHLICLENRANYGKYQRFIIGSWFIGTYSVPLLPKMFACPQQSNCNLCLNFEFSWYN